MLKEYGTGMYKIGADGRVRVESKTSQDAINHQTIKQSNGVEQFVYINPHKNQNRPSLSGPRGELVRTGEDLKREGNEALLVEQEEYSGGRVWVIGTDVIKSYKVNPVDHSVQVVWKGRHGRTTAKTFYPSYLRDFTFLKVEDVQGKTR